MMNKNVKDRKIWIGVLAFFIFLSWLFRFLTKNFPCSDWFVQFVLYYRPMQYFVIFFIWGVTLRYRIIQKKLRSYLHWVNVLMLFWLILRTLRFDIPETHAASRYLWYGYYIPYLVISALVFLAALHLNQPEDFRPSRYWGFMLEARKLLFEQAGAKEIRENCGGWKRTIDYLNHINHMDRDKLTEPVTAEELEQYAMRVGVRLVLAGTFPSRKDLCELYVDAIKECVANCVRHAKGRTLSATLSDAGIAIENDGNAPTKEIVELGGLRSLRQRAEELNCNMTVESVPKFRLHLTPGKEG